MKTMTITILSLWDTSQHEYDVVTDETDPEAILETVFIRQQDDTKDVPDIPSMCAGDIVSINSTKNTTKNRTLRSVSHINIII